MKNMVTTHIEGKDACYRALYRARRKVCKQSNLATGLAYLHIYVRVEGRFVASLFLNFRSLQEEI